MIATATCLWCQQPIQRTEACWVHQNGQSYAENGHAATPNRNKPPYTEGRGRACLRALPSASGVGREKPGLASGPACPPAADPPP